MTFPFICHPTIQNQTVTLTGFAKGAGMIMPNMATMLGAIITDANIEHSALKAALSAATEKTFNSITVDSDTSTNDSVFCLANGAAKNQKIQLDSAEYDVFYEALYSVCKTLALEIIKDAEGATKFITIHINQAPSEKIAKTCAMSIANSPLVKTAFFGNNLNWGRILMAMGKANLGLNYDDIDVSINDITIVQNGFCDENSSDYQKAEEAILAKEIVIEVNLKQGASNSTVWTCDLSYDYVKINGDYKT